jgi:hypothetical protein
MADNYIITITIYTIDVKISFTYKKENLSIDEIHDGSWLITDYPKDKVFSPFFMDNNWYLIEEAIGNWISDDFDETFPFILIRDITEYDSEILKNPLVQIKLNVIINRL